MKILFKILVVICFVQNLSGQQTGFARVGSSSQENTWLTSGTVVADQFDFKHFDDPEYQPSIPDDSQAMIATILEHVQLEDHQRALHLVEEVSDLYQKANHHKGQGDLYYIMGTIYERRGEWDLAIKYLAQASELFKREQHESELGYSLKKLGDIHATLNQHRLALQYYHEALAALRDQQDATIGHLHLEIGKAYKTLGKLDQASYHFNQLLDLEKPMNKEYLHADAHNHLGAIHLAQSSYDSALFYLELAFNQVVESDNLAQLKFISENLISLHENQSEPEKALVYHKVLNNASERLQNQQMAIREKQLKNDHAFEVERLQYQNLLKQTRLRLSVSLVGLVLAVLFIFTLVRNYLKKKKSLVVLQEKNEEILRTRQQMIAQEKMASLGQLAAGIAHEIKNPLNFVHNFAEGSIELVEELVKEMKQYDSTRLATVNKVQDLFESIKQNAFDIYTNSKRADQIINSVMDYAQGSRENFQAVDVHELINRNLQLAMHGSPTVDFALNVQVQKEFDTSLGVVDVIPQDFGRVLLNLFNNSFYALEEKGRNDISFVPTLRISTKMIPNDMLSISVWDNGPGIPEAMHNKIFTPFYTSKPPGDGNTGLGLSLSYDIVVSRHGGSLEFSSEDGRFTEFIIQVPINNGFHFKR